MGNLGGIVAGITAGGAPSLDLSALYNLIQNSGQYQIGLINALPDEIKKNLEAYAASMNQAGTAYTTGITNQNNKYLDQVKNLYGPNSDAANAEKAANKTAIYSTVPGTSEAIRSAMAATGGLSRGHAGTAIASPYVNAAQAYAESAMGTDAAQTKAGQSATAQAMQVINTMTDEMFTQMFGMSKAQAQQILTTGNQTLQTRLSQLITQNTNQTNQSLGVSGIQANNNYQNAVADAAKRYQMTSSIVNQGVSALAGGGGGGGGAGVMSFFRGLGSGGGSGMPAGSDVSSDSYFQNELNNTPA